MTPLVNYERKSTFNAFEPLLKCFFLNNSSSSMSFCVELWNILRKLAAYITFKIDQTKSHMG